MKVWPIDPLVPRNLRLEVPEKLPQGLTEKLVPGLDPCQWPSRTEALQCWPQFRQHNWMRERLARSLVPRQKDNALLSESVQDRRVTIQRIEIIRSLLGPMLNAG